MSLALSLHDGSWPEQSDSNAHRQDVSRTLVGFEQEITVSLTGPLNRPLMERAARAAAAGSAFELTSLRPDPSGSRGSWDAVFRLRAAVGVVGDAQIFALLRLLSGPVAWTGVRKNQDDRISLGFT